MQKEQALAERAGLKVHVSLWELPTVRRFRHTIDTERQNSSDYPVLQTLWIALTVSGLKTLQTPKSLRPR
jgi:hypothetical protein